MYNQVKECIKAGAENNYMLKWLVEGLTSSFLGIFTCFFFYPKTRTPQHSLLNLCSLLHPHTGEIIAEQIHIIKITFIHKRNGDIKVQSNAQNTPA